MSSATRSADVVHPAKVDEKGKGARCSSTSSVRRSPSHSGSPIAAGSHSSARLSTSRFNVPVAGAFDGKRRSRFAAEYAKGALPCHVAHGGSGFQMTLAWDVSEEELRQHRGELLTLCAEGLRETRHPHITVARLAFADLVELAGEPELDAESLRQTMQAVRLALMTPEEDKGLNSPAPCRGGAGWTSTFQGALAALKQLAAAEGARLNPHLHLVLPPIARRIFSKASRDVIHETLQVLERHGGPEALKIIKTRGCATYVVGL